MSGPYRVENEARKVSIDIVDSALGYTPGPLKTKVAWLELDQRTDTYHDCGGVPADKSQGWFPFGLTCARAAIAAATGGKS